MYCWVDLCPAPVVGDFRSATEWSIDPSDNRLRGARFDATDLSGLVKGLGIRLD